MLTILTSFAQEESRSVSENCEWQIRKQFAQGRPGSIGMLGYTLADGRLHIIPEEAEIVRTIFSDYLAGMSKIVLAQKLNDMGIRTKRGGLWHESMIKHLLSNEKYTGDMLLQKTFVSDHITKRRCINRGELPKYFVEESHAPIISKEAFAHVQEEMARKAWEHGSSEKIPTEEYPFSGLLVCGHCGKHYRHKVANAGSKYAAAVWICATFNKLGKQHCPSKQIPESILEEITMDVLGLPFDSSILQQHIKEILVREANHLIFVFRDGHTVERIWKDKSRRDSWNEAAKEQARQRQHEYMERSTCSSKQPE